MTGPLQDIDFTSLTIDEVLGLAKPSAEYEEDLKTFVPPPIDYDDQPKALSILRNFISLA